MERFIFVFNCNILFTMKKLGQMIKSFYLGAFKNIIDVNCNIIRNPYSMLDKPNHIILIIYN